MIQFADLIAPLEPTAFDDRHYGRQPVHIKATDGGAAAREVLDWSRFNRILDNRSHFNDRNFKLVLNTHPVRPENFQETGPAGQVRPSAPLVEVFAAMGASLVCDNAQELSPEIRALGDVLAERFMGDVAANIYCSFQNVQAFGAHYDIHEVFALQCEGEKVWRLYQNRAENPIQPPPPTEETLHELNAQKGELMFEAHARPGDLIYIPRGWFHEALASSEASLHLTLSVTPPAGDVLLDTLKTLALQDPAFRAYLADHRAKGGLSLAAQMSDLGERLKRLCESPAVRTEVAAVQRSARRRPFEFTLPHRPTLEWLAVIQPAAHVKASAQGPLLAGAGAPMPLGLLREPAEWMLGRPALTIQELLARFPQFDETELRGLVEGLVGRGVLERIPSPLLGSQAPSRQTA